MVYLFWYVVLDRFLTNWLSLMVKNHPQNLIPDLSEVGKYTLSF